MSKSIAGKFLENLNESVLAVSEGKLEIDLAKAEKIVNLLKSKGLSAAAYSTEYGFNGIYVENRYASLGADTKGFFVNITVDKYARLPMSEATKMKEELDEMISILEGIKKIDGNLV